MDEKYDQELKNFSIASATKTNMTTPPATTSMVNQATPKIFDFQWNFKYNRGVMLRFSPHFVPLVITITYFSYLFRQTLSNQTVSHHL